MAGPACDSLQLPLVRRRLVHRPRPAHTRVHARTHAPARAREWDAEPRWGGERGRPDEGAHDLQVQQHQRLALRKLPQPLLPRPQRARARLRAARRARASPGPRTAPPVPREAAAAAAPTRAGGRPVWGRRQGKQAGQDQKGIGGGGGRGLKRRRRGAGEERGRIGGYIGHLEHVDDQRDVRPLPAIHARACTRKLTGHTHAHANARAHGPGWWWWRWWWRWGGGGRAALPDVPETPPPAANPRPRAPTPSHDRRRGCGAAAP